MNKKLMHTLTVTGLLLISLLALAACQPSESEQPERSVAASTARWEAMADFYATRSQRAIAADQARWEAMGQYYAELAEAARARSLAADQARWQAQAEFYANQGQLVAANRSDLALAAHYTGLAFQHFELTGNPAGLPNSISPELKGLLLASGVQVEAALATVSSHQSQ